MNNGIFTVSLDFELYWGLRDKRCIQDYTANLKGTLSAADKMLTLFDEFNVHATWATVGFLFAGEQNELQQYLPLVKPNYTDPNLSPYGYIASQHNLEPCYHFAGNFIKKIIASRNQEVGTHTFSHYYCLESGQSQREFNADMAAAKLIADSKGINIRSLVFPRNQWNNKYLSTLKNHGIVSFRGNEKSWIYRASEGKNEKIIKRGLRLIDSYVNLTGSNTYKFVDIAKEADNQPFNIPSSRFLRPISNKFSMLEKMRMKRIKKAIESAAKKNEIFHLWWHPHNFGVNTEANIKFLSEIFSFFREMQHKYGMQSLNMAEISYLILEGNKT